MRAWFAQRPAVHFTNRDLADALGEDIRGIASMMRRMWTAGELERRSPILRPDCTIPYHWRLATGVVQTVTVPAWTPRYGNDRRSLARRALRRRGRHLALAGG
jgi:hypothetical protein